MKDKPFPAQMLHKYTYEQLERIAIKTESGIPDDEAERQMLREEKIERFMKVDNARNQRGKILHGL